MEKLDIENIDYNNTDENNGSLCVHIFNKDYTDYQTKIFKQNNFNNTTKFYNSFVYDIQNDKFYYDNSANTNKTDSLKLNLCDLTNSKDVYNLQLNKNGNNINYTFDIYIIVNDTNKEINLTKFNFDLINNGQVNIKLIRQTKNEYKEITEKDYTLILNKNYKYINTVNINVEIRASNEQGVENQEELTDSFINFDIVFKDKKTNEINEKINSEILIKYSDDEIYHLENFLEQNKKYKKNDYIVKLNHDFVYKNINEFKKFIETNQNKKNINILDNKHLEKIEKQMASNEQINNAIKRFPNGCIIKWIGNNDYKNNSICNFNVLAERYANKKYDIENIMKMIVCKNEDIKRVYATALWKRGLEMEFNKTKSENEIMTTNSITKPNDDIEQIPIINDTSFAITNENESINNTNIDNENTKKTKNPKAVIKNGIVDNKKRNKKYKELIKTGRHMAENYQKIVNNCREILEENKNILKNLNDALEQTKIFKLSCSKKADFSINTYNHQSI